MGFGAKYRGKDYNVHMKRDGSIKLSRPRGGSKIAPAWGGKAPSKSDTLYTPAAHEGKNAGIKKLMPQVVQPGYAAYGGINRNNPVSTRGISREGRNQPRVFSNDKLNPAPRGASSQASSTLASIMG